MAKNTGRESSTPPQGDVTTRARETPPQLHLARKVPQDAPAAMGICNVSNEDRVKAVETLRRDEAPALKRYLQKRLHSRQDVDDALQEIFSRLLVPQKAPIQDEVKFLYGTANNVVLEILRARMKSEQRAPAEPVAEEGDGEPPDALSRIGDPSPGPAEIEEQRRTELLLTTARQRMDALHQAVYVARLIDGLSVQETANKCGVSVHKVERLLNEARTYVTNFVTAREKEIL